MVSESLKPETMVSGSLKRLLTW